MTAQPSPSEEAAKPKNPWIKRAILIALAVIFLGVALILIFHKDYKPKDWGDFNVLAERPPRPTPPAYNGKQVPPDEYLKWVYWGEEWFRNTTFGNERLWTDVVGVFNGYVDVPEGAGGWRSEPVFKYFIEAIDNLDGVKGNLYSGNGGAYTSDLVINFPPGTMLDKTFPIPEKLHTGLDVEAGSAWPLGVVPVRASAEEESLPYLYNPADYQASVGPLPGGGKFRAGLSCALCHYSLDVDWDGKPDLKSARPTEPTPGSPYRPDHAWAIGNQDIHLGWIFALSRNTIAGFETSGPVNKTSIDDARHWAEQVLNNYKTNPAETKREVDRGLLTFPRGYADDTPDGLHNPLQFPSLFTRMNWPYNYDGVMLNASDRNNNVWTVGLDVSGLVALCNDRGGSTAKLFFWEKQGFYSVLKAEDYADIVVCYSPAVAYDPAQREVLKADILGTSDGVPGMLDKNSVILIKGVPGTIPDAVFNHDDNKRFNRIRTPDQFGTDGGNRGPVIGLLGTRVVTPQAVRAEYNIGELESRYGLNADEFLTEAVSLMLDWVEPPPNRSALLERARQAGLIQKGYEIFKSQGCASCHAGPFLTNNTIVARKKIGTDTARADATAPLQTFLAPRYDPATGYAVSTGFFNFITKWFEGERPGYKVVTLRYLWGSAPYLHDGGVGVALRPDSPPPGDDLGSLLRRPEGDKLYGIAKILSYREANPDSYLRANAALSLQALLLESERKILIDQNQKAPYPIPGSSESITMDKMHIQGVGHEFWIKDEPGGDTITALVAFLLALDDDPGQ